MPFTHSYCLNWKEKKENNTVHHCFIQRPSISKPNQYCSMGNNFPFKQTKKRYKASELPMLSLNTIDAITEHIGEFYGPSDVI